MLWVMTGAGTNWEIVWEEMMDFWDGDGYQVGARIMRGMGRIPGTYTNCGVRGTFSLNSFQVCGSHLVFLKFLRLSHF